MSIIAGSNLKRMDFDLTRMVEMQQLKQRLNELRDTRKKHYQQLEDKKRRADEIASSYVKYDSYTRE